MMLARVVLPRPGGPKISVWSSGSPRPFAAARKISICSRTTRWPTYSARLRGRMARSITSSATSAPPGAIRRSVSITGGSSCVDHGFQRASYQLLAIRNAVVIHRGDHTARLLRFVSERDQGPLGIGHDIVGPRSRERSALPAATGTRQPLFEPVAHFNQQALCGFLSHAGQRDQRGDI